MSENVAIVLQILLPKKKERPVENGRFFTLQSFSELKGVSKNPYQR